MLKRIFDTINRIANSSNEKQEKKSYSKQDLISWATGCMLEGLPEEFQSAWIEVVQAENTKKISYKFIANDEGLIEKFQAADDLYLVQCIELLDEHLPEEKRNWKKCVLKFDMQISSLDYTY